MDEMFINALFTLLITLNSHKMRIK